MMQDSTASTVAGHEMEKNCALALRGQGTHKSIAESEPFSALQACLEDIQAVAIESVVSDIHTFRQTSEFEQGHWPSVLRDDATLHEPVLAHLC